MKKPSKKPVVPDLKSAARVALGRTATWMEAADWEVLFGLHPEKRTTAAETAAFAEAKILAIEYVRKGATL